MFLPKTPQSSSLDVFPLEILLQILQNLTITSLHAILRLYRRSRITFSTYHTQIINHILLSTLPDPKFPTYFPHTYKGVIYPRPPSKPLQTSHVEAYTQLRYAQSLVSLSDAISSLTTYIYSITSPQILEKITPRGTILLNRYAQFPYEEALTSTIYRIVISNSQTFFYTSQLELAQTFSNSSPFIPPPRPPPPKYPESVARRILPPELLPKETSSDEITSQLSNLHGPETSFLKRQTYRYLRRLVLGALTAYLKQHEFFNGVCIIPSWEYMHDSASIRDGLFLYLGIHPKLLFKVLVQCNLEDKDKAIRGVGGDRLSSKEKREKKARPAVAVELGKAYAIVCKVTHEHLEEMKRYAKRKPVLTDFEEVFNVNHRGESRT
ncbi:hypothetical protein TWF970_005793 [Orbilia oligospora]|uniref:F-box domain-containing protein n=1 Tax=Orbilia oligospora TaxID=2813651 RepID=A0A7C8RGA3_ORBOL|nr:hypothetical protein TWF970_005793 [Orbilia oligospora]